MAKVEWQASYSVGVEDLDQQHRALFEVINKLDDAIAGARRHEIMGAFSHLLDYARGHFAFEEAFMARTKHADLDAHQLEHAAFVDRVMRLWEEFLADRGDVAPRLLEFMQDWLVHHVRHTDQGYNPNR